MGKIRIVTLSIATVVAVVAWIYSMNDAYYSNDRIAIAKYAQDAELMPGKDVPLKHYVSYIENKMNKIGYKDVKVKIKGEDLPGIENKIFIEAIPPQSPLDWLFRVTPDTITYSYKFINWR
ncbi:hypothetical protein ACOMCU_01835 [Lysinibacillus sp. UGB7]|uniref:hypothetical protein n=1 Tax=Lysinibacillus sp. UGB7 TaxID=3411039 RepID=UPI003B7E64B4